MSLEEALAHFTGARPGTLDSSGRLKREAPSEITNKPMHSNGPLVVKICRVAQPAATYHRTNTALPELRSVVTVGNQPTSEQRGDVNEHRLSRQNALVKFENIQNAVMTQGLTTSATNTVTFRNTSNVAVVPASFSNSGNANVNQGCFCKRSKCLKLYCKCFQGGLFCDSRNCRCNDCRNLLEHDGPKGERRVAIMEIQERRPDAFDKRPTKRTGEGCSCKKSR